MTGQKANEILYRMITIGFDIESQELVSQWLEACRMYLAGDAILPFPDCDVEDLLQMELACKKLDLYYQMCHRFDLPCDEERVTMEKDRLAAAIDSAIAKDLQNYRRRCRLCGKILPWNTPFGICGDCFGRRRGGTAFQAAGRDGSPRFGSRNSHAGRSKESSHFTGPDRHGYRTGQYKSRPGLRARRRNPQ